MQLGKLSFAPAQEARELLGRPVDAYLAEREFKDKVWASGIDATLADTAAFCEHYDIGLDVSANCVIVEAKRGERTWYAAVMILATMRADVNGVIRRQLDARKISFASMNSAVTLTGMEYGGITPLGLPADWPVLIDEHVLARPQLVIGSGIRGSKLLVSNEVLSELPGALVLPLAKKAE